MVDLSLVIQLFSSNISGLTEILPEFKILCEVLPTMAAKILFVEDEPLARNLFCQVLRNEGYRVIEAGDGTEALELLQTQHVDLVISDVMMPKMQGTRFVEHLRSFHPGIPVMLITGYLSEVSGKNVLQDVAEIMPKPIDLDAFRSTVKRLLDNSATA